MSNYANLELCRELYELSQWHDTDWSYDVNGHGFTFSRQENGVPAYDAGYLLRMLPKGSTACKLSPLTKPYDAPDRYSAWYFGEVTQQYADTPENALCKLAIELFKAKVINRTKPVQKD